MADMTIAKTILEQLGGGKFRMMTGAKDFIGAERALMFRLPGAGGFCKGGINKVAITLLPSDTYKVEFYRIRGKVVKVVESCEDVYCDQLKPVFERVTGLRTRF